MNTHFKHLQLGNVDDNGVFIPGQPIVQRQTRKMLKLIETYVARWESGRIEVEEGFECDQASIPRIFWVIIPKGGLHDGPSIIHDWCYQNLWRSRWESDQLFLHAMRVAGTWWLRRMVIYLAVRCFGWVIWRTRSLLREADAATDEKETT